VLVDEHDNDLGTMEKMAAHVDGGTLHRAFSVFLFDP
jgi:isopentenyl-diphosphate delta-isomerase